MDENFNNQQPENGNFTPEQPQQDFTQQTAQPYQQDYTQQTAQPYQQDYTQQTAQPYQQDYTQQNNQQNAQPYQQGYSQQNTQYQQNYNQQYNEPYYNQQYPSYPTEEKPKALAITSMVLGICSIVFSCCVPFLPFAAGVAGLILGIMSVKKDQGGRGMAIAGIVMSAIAVALSVVCIILFLVAGSAGSLAAYSDILNGYNYY